MREERRGVGVLKTSACCTLSGVKYIPLPDSAAKGGCGASLYEGPYTPRTEQYKGPYTPRAKAEEYEGVLHTQSKGGTV